MYCTFTFEDRGTKLVEADAAQFNLYRAAKTADDYIIGTTTANYDWTTGYTTTPATKSYDTDHWKTTDWFWANNLTYYHFRAAGTGESANGNPTVINDPSGDYFPITSGAVTGSDYRDYVWGAPFTYVDNTYLMKYDGTNGFSLGSDGTTKFLKDGKVLMGTGAVSTTSTTRTESDYFAKGTYTAESGATPAQVANSAFGIVPQALSWGNNTPGTETIGLRITTPDGNQYIVKDLSTCTATVTANNLVNPYTGTSPYTINAWYPHYKYNYTVTLVQAGVENITAAVVAWEEVSGDLGTISLEN